MQLLNTPLGEIVAQKGADLVLRGLDTAYSEELADRLVIALPQELEKATEGMSDRAKNIIKALNQQNSALQQQLQSAQMDLKHGLTKTLHQEATKLQVEHLKDKRAEADTHTDAFTKIEDTHTRAHTAIEVAEINQGGDIIKSRLEHGHDMELAEQMAEHAAAAEKTNGAKAQR
jgi:RNase H-fold protein (predicted Holliday junction resolvase)